MKLDSLISQLISDEGIRLKPYRDSLGVLSIGIGRNLDDVGITQDEAMLLLQNDIRKAYADLTTALPWVQTLDDVRQNVLIAMTFNMGIGGLLKFKNTLGMIQRHEYNQAASAMLQSLWATQVGARAKRLADQMRTGSND